MASEQSPVLMPAGGIGAEYGRISARAGAITSAAVSHMCASTPWRLLSESVRSRAPRSTITARFPSGAKISISSRILTLRYCSVTLPPQAADERGVYESRSRDVLEMKCSRPAPPRVGPGVSVADNHEGERRNRRGQVHVLLRHQSSRRPKYIAVSTCQATPRRCRTRPTD